jgi:hypothetical protein
LLIIGIFRVWWLSTGGCGLPERYPAMAEKRFVKVTITVETDDQHTTITRQGTQSVAQHFAEAIWRVADTFHTEVLADIAQAVAETMRKRTRPVDHG